MYYRRQLDRKHAAAFRYSGYSAHTTADGTSEPYDLTSTYEIQSTPQWLTRFEYRYDASNQPDFVGSSYGTTRKSQSTLIAAEVFTF